MKQIKREKPKAGQASPSSRKHEPGDRAQMLSPQAFYAQLVKRPDIRELLKRLAR
jgi:hypothetical protein